MKIRDISVKILFISLSVSNFFDSDKIELRQPLSLSKKFDSDNSCLSHCRTFSTDFMDCTNVELSLVGEGEGGGGVVRSH